MILTIEITDCNDGEDNDGDGLVDLDDPGCDSADDGSESNPAQCTPYWRCTDWSECSNGERTRTCEDWSVCGTAAGKPAETQSCSEEESNLTVAEEKITPPPGVGAAVGLFSRIKANWLAILIMALVLALLTLVGWKRKSLGATFKKLASFRTHQRLKEEAEIREKLKREGILK